MDAQTSSTRDQLTPATALGLLRDGNDRFLANRRADRNLLDQVRATAHGQWPFAAVLSCIDSRTSTELIFDQGIGDVFSIRIAGNFLNDDILASMEFACAVAGAKLVVVLGHSQCGAIKGACDGVELGMLTGMLKKFGPAIAAVPTPTAPAERTSKNVEFVESVARENVAQTVSGVTDRSTVLRGLQHAGAIEVVGGMYDISTGGVDFFCGGVGDGSLRS
jgi:carbonic anhydrase